MKSYDDIEIENRNIADLSRCGKFRYTNMLLMVMEKTDKFSVEGRHAIVHTPQQDCRHISLPHNIIIEEVRVQYLTFNVGSAGVSDGHGGIALHEKQGDWDACVGSSMCLLSDNTALVCKECRNEIIENKMTGWLSRNVF